MSPIALDNKNALRRYLTDTLVSAGSDMSLNHIDVSAITDFSLPTNF